MVVAVILELHSSAESGSCNVGNERKGECPGLWDDLTSAVFSPLQLVFPCCFFSFFLRAFETSCKW